MFSIEVSPPSLELEPLDLLPSQFALEKMSFQLCCGPSVRWGWFFVFCFDRSERARRGPNARERRERGAVAEVGRQEDRQLRLWGQGACNAGTL